ncbi:RNA polymerase sigma-70 factor [Pedobacter helvus]|uniref:RNA polymerase sigma-70 factor n=1 Tax=Pedobacter helvus TaxID=2563444 RepID=A0ABW9JN34_9SPHI|nr:RNA polymerase sigma-70 factor [Pedobacter ureilyticus]
MPSYRSYSDSELSYLLTQDDEQAFTEIYHRFYGLLFIHASKRLNDDEEAKDAVQQLFESLWQKRAQVQADGNLSAYLYTAIRHRILDIFSHQEVENKYVDSLQSFIDQEQEFTDYRVREKQMKALIEKEIDSLPPKMREIFLLSRIENKSHKEIAAQLGISELTVKTQVKKALKILRSKLGLLAYVVFLFKAA